MYQPSCAFPVLASLAGVAAAAGAGERLRLPAAATGVPHMLQNLPSAGMVFPHSRH
jgi:hypothetical protein